MRYPVSITVNGVRRRGDVEARLLLVHYLRESLGLTGTNVGCDTSQCGACTVLMDGKAVKSCTVLTVHAPHWLVSQPTLVPVRPNDSRR